MRPRHVRPKPLAELAALLATAITETCGAAAATGAGPPAPGELLLTGLTHDSRRVLPGDLYVALPGSHHHGAEFSGKAAAAGAVAMLTDAAGSRRAAAGGLPVLTVADPRARLGEVASWAYGNPSAHLLLVGVTGTSGKTTTTYFLEAALKMAGHRTGLIGGVQTRIAGETAASTLTTPEAPDLQAMFAVMTERGVSAAAMEVSSHALALGRVAGTSYDVAVFTNLSQDHLDFHADIDDYFAAKARLFTPEYSPVGVVNVDDRYGRMLAGSAPIPVTTFSAEGNPGADWRAVDVRLGTDGSSMRVVGPGGVDADGVVALPGPFNVANALGAVVAMIEAGIGLQTAVAGVAACPGVPGRLEPIDVGQDFTVLVDYSHKPAAVEAVLRALRPVTQGTLTIVLGCGGDRDTAKRPMMGAIAALLADVAIFTSDNPRSEDPLAILTAMLDGAVDVPQAQRAHVIVEPDRAAAIAFAVRAAGRGDVVVVAGKGHETGQYVADSVVPFDDRQVAAEALAYERARRGPWPTSLAASDSEDV
jgi:UDP-N-acetylmuramoyl-L-alanyl-D-glutamate--2,6-diaminopimelate ligase